MIEMTSEKMQELIGVFVNKYGKLPSEAFKLKHNETVPVGLKPRDDLIVEMACLLRLPEGLPIFEKEFGELREMKRMNDKLDSYLVSYQ